MAEDTYLFIDGKYLREIHRKTLDPLFGFVPQIDFVQIKGQAAAGRVFYYDCLNDIKKEQESEADFISRVQELENEFSRIRGHYGFHVRLGTLTGKAKRLRQKEVDVQLTVDMLTHGLNKNMKKAILLAGDLDFRPIVEALVRNGVFVEIWYEKTSASRELFWAADFGRQLDLRDIYSFSDSDWTRANQLPRIHEGDWRAIQELHLRRGRVLGNFIYQSRDGLDFKFFVSEWQGKALTLVHNNVELLEKYFKVCYAPIEWDI